MKNFPSSLLIPVALLLAVAGFYIYNYVTFVHTPPALTDKEQRMIDTLFATPKTQCMGRFVFEVPRSFNNALTDAVQIGRVKIISKRTYRPAFDQRILRREQELKNGHTVDPLDQPFLKQVIRLSENAVIFDRNKNGSVPGFGRTLEGHLYADGVAFSLTLDITDYSDPRYAKERAFFLRDEAERPAWMANDKPQKLAELKDIMSRLSGREDEEIPTQPGICIAEGFLRDGNVKPKEDITFIYRHASAFSFTVWSDSSLKEETTMLEQSGEIQQYINSINGRTLRKAQAQIAGFDASEWLITAPPEKSFDNQSEQLMFTAIANEKIADLKHPNLDLTFSNESMRRVQVSQAAYSTAELVEIWDRITRSFRVRKNAF